MQSLQCITDIALRKKKRFIQFCIELELPQHERRTTIITTTTIFFDIFFFLCVWTFWHSVIFVMMSVYSLFFHFTHSYSLNPMILLGDLNSGCWTALSMWKSAGIVCHVRKNIDFEWIPISMWNTDRNEINCNNSSKLLLLYDYQDEYRTSFGSLNESLFLFFAIKMTFNRNDYIFFMMKIPSFAKWVLVLVCI